VYNIKSGVEMTSLICVSCKTDKRVKYGSMKHPYCKKCFDKKFDGDIDKYWEWMDKHHDGMLSVGDLILVR